MREIMLSLTRSRSNLSREKCLLKIHSCRIPARFLHCFCTPSVGHRPFSLVLLSSEVKGPQSFIFSSILRGICSFEPLILHLKTERVSYMRRVLSMLSRGRFMARSRSLFAPFSHFSLPYPPPQLSPLLPFLTTVPTLLSFVAESMVCTCENACGKRKPALPTGAPPVSQSLLPHS